MRSTTHLVFGAGVAGLAAALAGCRVECWMLSMLASAVANLLVDAAGHDHRLFSAPRRTRVTHSLPGMTTVALIVWWLASKSTVYGGERLGLAAAVLAGTLSHWVLDSLNPSGVYIVRGRFRIARISYSNPMVNALLQVAGAVMAAYSAVLVYHGVP